MTTVRAGGTAGTGWRGQSDPQRFELYNRWSLYFLLIFGPIVGISAAASLANATGTQAWFGPAATAGFLIQTGVAEIVLARGLNHYLGRAARPTRTAAVLVVITLLLIALAAVPLMQAEPLPTDDGRLLMPGWVLLAPVGIALSALAPLFTTRWLVTAGVLAMGGAAALQTWGSGEPRALVPFVISGTLVVIGVVLSFRVSAWMIGVVWEQANRREVDARLAVAEERLRFSRDLHDIFGRTLSTVAVTSELAAELARRGDPRGPDKMLEVRQIAQDALREVRDVVEGYRRADLPTELAGAREILRSAGITAEVRGEELVLGEQAAEGLGWVVREGVTNVVRHADARTAGITVEIADGGAQVVIVNDGVRPVATARPGSGLHGLRERLATIGGRIEAGVDDADQSQFRLEAWVPDDKEVTP
ncbi:sensor histidine kinase [Ruania alba]|uniref:Two-component system, NarL family, sensor histidine kinase DesK n=1 Tax=Ruania alba TaxID=648782 RepID=A0A1H5HH53_9MICO|nr:histidine kinase [Ruania alba]SEE27376.1 two-component system, NarL family, sensor histidine kinase DesK [Ruania alba]